MLKLMIVDDEPVIVEGIRDMVIQEKSAFDKVTLAHDGIEALEIMDYFLPDLLITDIQMPEMDGLELIRQSQRKGVSRFVILSGYDDFEYARQGIRLRVVDYLLKPVDQEVLGDLLKKSAIQIIEDRQNQGDDESDACCEHVSTGNGKVKMLQEYITNHFTRDISLEDASNYLGLHPSYVSQLLKKETGYTFVQYVTQLRIQKTKELLSRDPDISLEKIARCVGYENRRHFYKVFKKHVGLTPGEYRDSCRKSHGYNRKG